MKILEIKDNILRYRQQYLNHLYPYIEVALNILSIVAHIASAVVIVLAILQIGYQFDDKKLGITYDAYEVIWWIYIADRCLHLIFNRKKYLKQKYSKIGWCINALLLVHVLEPLFNETATPFFTNFHWFSLICVSILDLSYETIHLLGKRTNPASVLALSFLILIFAGSAVLSMPECISDRTSYTWIDSLFTATSAVCVTGLSTVDVSSVYTPIGQLVILVLIQLGGLGIMTITSFFALFFMGNTSLYNQMVMRDMVNTDSLNSLYTVLKNIISFTFFIELFGAIFIFLTILDFKDMSMSDKIFFSIFHSISAFCNAGFSTYSEGLSNSIFLHNHNAFFIIISIIIILGSIGYPILVNLKLAVYHRMQNIINRIKGKYYASMSIPHLFDLNTKIVLSTTCILLFAGTLLIGAFEWNSAFADLSVSEKITQSFFNSVSPRTAGFSSINLSLMSSQTIIIYSFLMWIGGAAQSTAGGVKVNAFAVAILNMRAIMRNTIHVEVFGRELSLDSIRRANATIFASIALIGLSVFAMSIIQPNFSLRDIAFECVSAVSTVGSSLGITSDLNITGKVFIIILMFIGRVGAITLLQGLISPKKHLNYSFPKDNIIIS